MKRVVAAAALVLTIKSGALGQAQEGSYAARQNLGWVAGYLSVCPYLRPTPGLAVEVRKRLAEKSLTPDDTIYAMAQREAIMHADRTLRDDFCDTALDAFGPEGERAKGWIVRDFGTLPRPVDWLIAFSNDEDPADPVRDTLRVLAGVSVAMKDCDSIDVTPVFVDLVTRQGIEVDDLYRGILSGPFFAEVMGFLRWQSHDPQRVKDACTIALRNYGPGGRVQAGLIKSK